MSNREHELLVQALADRDPEAAALVTRAHVGELHRTMFVGLGR
jgi:DNA-binding GntR family transcriptional regulator